ncbi:MAG: hypothetical protein LBB80_08850 [Treponema sp.]|nr:hypothetical protein [Treponema sp.]
MMIKVFVYGYMTKICSSRMLVKALEQKVNSAYSLVPRRVNRPLCFIHINLSFVYAMNNRTSSSREAGSCSRYYLNLQLILSA